MATEPTQLPTRDKPRVAVDLDAAAAARREALGEAPIVVFREQTFQLPPECPFSLIEDLDAISQAQADGDGGVAATATIHIMQALLGEAYDRFVALGPSMSDLEAMIEGVLPAYGFQEDSRGN